MKCNSFGINYAVKSGTYKVNYRPEQAMKKKPVTYDEVDMEQMSLFDTVKDDDILKELKELDISNLTPLDALNTLNRLQSKLRNRW